MRSWALTSVFAALAFSGCYGSTEPATEVQEHSAQLNARGTANQGSAVSEFEYRPTNGTGFLRRTDPRTWPAGASGPFSEKVEGLLPATPYEFRLCGSNTSDGAGGCANTRTFTTRKPDGDGIEAIFWAYPLPPRAVDVSVRARSGPGGENPSGRIVSQSGNYTGFVTCLVVEGQRAAVVSVGQRGSENDPGPEFLWYTFAGPGEGLLDGATGDGTGPDCTALSLEGEPGPPVPAIPEIAIWDSP